MPRLPARPAGRQVGGKVGGGGSPCSTARAGALCSSRTGSRVRIAHPLRSQAMRPLRAYPIGGLVISVGVSNSSFNGRAVRAVVDDAEQVSCRGTSSSTAVLLSA